MLKKGLDNLCLTISDDVLKVAQVKGSGANAKVSLIASQDVADVPSDKLPSIVLSVIAKVNAKNANIVYIIPSSHTTTKNIEIPSVNPEEIRSIVNLQAGRHTPYSRDEIQIGYVNIGAQKANYSKVLLVIANRNTLKEQISVFEKAGLKIKKVLFAPEGIANLYAEGLNLKKDAVPTAIIDIGRKSTEFVVSHKGLPIASRNIPIGREHLTADAQSGMANLVDELNKTMESYKNDDIEQLPVNFLITSTDEMAQQLQNALNEKLKWAAKTSPYVDLVKTSQDALKQIASDSTQTSFLDVVASGGIAFSSQVDLMPEDVQLQKSIEDQGKEIFKTAALTLIILITFACGLGLRAYFKSAYLKKMDKQYEGIRSEVDVLEKQSMKSQIVQQHLIASMVSLDVLNELYRKIPNEVYLTSIAMDENGNISIQGISDVASIVFNLGTALKESEYFKSVDIKSTTSKKDRGKDVSAFEITLKLATAADEIVSLTEGEAEGAK